MPPKENMIWIAYNHMPGGQIVVMWFADIVRHRKLGGDATQEVKFPSSDQLTEFKKGAQVATNVKGKLTRNQVLVYNGPSLGADPKANSKVIAWAIEQGLEPIITKAEKDASPAEISKRVAALEGGMEDVQKTQGRILSILERLEKAAPVGAGK